MNRTKTVLLEFDPELNKLGKNKKLRDGLSAVVQIGDTLWVANDETLSLERLTRQYRTGNGEIRFGDHRQFALHDYLRLPVPPSARAEENGKIEEADIEGLDFQDGYLWLVGSHSLKRGNPKEEDSIKKNTKRLKKIRHDGNRFLLARIPLEKATQSLKKTVEQDGNSRTAARLCGDPDGNALTEALATDEHLGPFLTIPGKDNGFDIEGLAVAGDRVFVGLRGPVLRGWALILELALEAKNDFTLKLKPIGPDGQPYRKHFLDLRGLGVRDLCVEGSDLLILAGPTMTLTHPPIVFRWPGGARPDQESLVFAKRLPTVLNPFVKDLDTRRGQAEGITLFGPKREGTRSALIVYDATPSNGEGETTTTEADLFTLSG